MDSGSDVTVMERPLAKKLGLTLGHSPMILKSNANKTNRFWIHESAKGAVLFPDCSTSLNIFIILDKLQNKSLILGQNILHRDDLIVILRSGQKWFLELKNQGHQEAVELNNVTPKVYKFYRLPHAKQNEFQNR